MASFKNRARDNFVDETILSTPLPEATSTANINKSPSSGFAKPMSTSNLTSRLTGTIDELKTVNEALNSAEKVSLGQNNSILSVTDLAFDQKLGLKGSLGILDIDALLDKDPIYSKGDSSNKSRSSIGRPMKIQAPVNGSAVGVPSFFLTADRSISEDGSFSGEPSCILGDTISETSAEVAAIMAKDSSFDSGRISFDQGEMSGRSTSLGASVNVSSGTSLKNLSAVAVEGEEFVADEELLKRLQMDELSFVEKQLPPIIHPEQIPNPNSSSVSVFSGVHEGEKIMVKPSWIGLEAENDDPINISIGQYFRLKSDFTPHHSGPQTSENRPNFGMKITSPERRGERQIGLISQSFDSSSLETSSSTPKKSLNLTQVISPKFHTPSQPDAEANETNVDLTNLSIVSTPSLSCINNILHEIDMNDSHRTMADKLLRYSSSSTGSKKHDQDLLSNLYSAKNNVNAFTENNVESKTMIDKQKINVWTPKNPQSAAAVKTSRELDHYSNKAIDGEGVKYKVRDVVKKLNSIERKGLSNKSALKMLSNFVNKLESNVAGPLECSALYESLSADKLVSAGPLNVSKEDGCGGISFASEYSGAKCWVEVPKELLLVPDGDAVQQRHCIGIGFTAHVPIRNQTNEWLMYQVLPANGDGKLFVEELPIQTLLAPSSLVEFEVIVVPMSAGKHFADIEIKVTNFMVQKDLPMQSYFTRLVLSASIPNVKVMTEKLVELGDKEVLKFGILPEECSKTVLVHILNIGLSNIPIRVVIDEVPEAIKAFRISYASRSPLSNSSSSKYQLDDVSSHSGIHLEREDLLSCDLQGSGPHAMVAVAITGQAPRFDWATHKTPSDLSELGARVRVELDVPSNLPSELTVLKEVILSGFVALTKLKVDVEKEPLTFLSEEVTSLSQQSKGAFPKKIPGSQKKYKMVSELIPLSNLGAVSLNLTLSVLMADGNQIKGDEDEFSIIPDSLSLQPGERSSVRVIYQPKFNESLECNRVLSISIGPNRAIKTIALKGFPVCTDVWRNEADNVTEAMTTFSCPADSNHPVIQTTHPRLVWGSVPVNSDYAESVFTLRNPSQALEKIALSIKGSKDYKLLNHESDIVGNTSFEMLPKQSEKIKIFFRPKMLGPSVGKLIISVYDGSHKERKIADKMITLSGYGGSSMVEVISLPKDLSGRLWLNLGLVSSNSTCNTSLESYSPQNKRSSSRSPSPTLLVTTVKNRLQIHNSGSLPAFVKIVPLTTGAHPETLSHLEEAREHSVTVRPDFCDLEPSTSVTIWVSYVHRLHGNAHENNREVSVKRGSERAYEEVANLLIVSGDLPTRSRLQRIYKSAEITQSKKDPAKFLGLSATLLGFIGVTSSFGTKPELEEALESTGQDDALNSLCDPVSKETVNSLIQALKTTEVLLVVEKDDQAKNPVNGIDATLTLSSEEELFHSLLDVTNQQPSFLGEVPALKSRPSSKLWSIEPGGTVYLGSVGGLSATVVLVSHSSEDIFFEARVGFVEMDGRLKLIPPPHRRSVQTSESIIPVVVEPWQGRLLPHSCIKMKVILQEVSEYPSKSGILQVYSENDCLKINIKIEGCGSQCIPKGRTLKNIESNEVMLKTATGRKNRIFCGAQDDNIKSYGNANMQSCQPLGHLTDRHKKRDQFPVSADTESLVFPATKVGSSVILKLTLRNPSNETFKVITYPVYKPYTVPKGSWELKANYYFSIKVAFSPESAGNYEETLAIEVASQESSKKNLVKVSLRGRATL